MKVADEIGRHRCEYAFHKAARPIHWSRNSPQHMTSWFTLEENVIMGGAGQRGA
jgi:hypothetical protein